MLPNTAFCDGMQQKNDGSSELWTTFPQEQLQTMPPDLLVSSSLDSQNVQLETSTPVA